MRSVWSLGMLTGMLAAMVLEAGCSDEASGPGASPTTPQSTTAAPPSSETTPTAGVPAEPTAPTSPAAVDLRSPEELAVAGRSTYNANCIACHAMDPRTDGALGPAVAGSTLELIEARVMRSEYPAGYAPKRATRVMVPMPHLQPKLPELAAYLGSLQSAPRP